MLLAPFTPPFPPCFFWGQGAAGQADMGVPPLEVTENPSPLLSDAKVRVGACFLAFWGVVFLGGRFFGCPRARDPLTAIKYRCLLGVVYVRAGDRFKSMVHTVFVFFGTVFIQRFCSPVR